MVDTRNIWAGDGVDPNQGLCLGLGGFGSTYVSCVSGPAPTCVVDPYWVDTQLLAHFDNISSPSTFKNETGLAMVTQGVFQTNDPKFGSGGAYFDGASYLEGLPAGLALSDDEYTLEAWVYPTAFASIYGPVFAWSSGTTNTEKFLAVNAAGQAQMSDTTAGNAMGPTALLLNEWSHIAAVYFNNTMTVYVNGVPGTPSAWNTSWRVVSTPMHIGTVDLDIGLNQRNFNGWIDEARVTNKARYLAPFTPDAMQACPDSTDGSDPIFTAFQTKAMTDLGATGYWSFDEGIDKAFDSVGNVVIDLANANFNSAPLVPTGQSVVFNNTGTQYCTAPNNAVFNTPDFTLNFMTKRGISTLEDAEGLVVKADTSATSDWKVNFTATGVVAFGTQRLNGATLANLKTLTSYDDNTTHMITCTLKVVGGSTEAKIYIDGVLDASETWPGLISYSTTGIDLGRMARTGSIPSKYYNGTTDELSVYATALTAQEITDLYALRSL